MSDKKELLTVEDKKTELAVPEEPKAVTPIENKEKIKRNSLIEISEEIVLNSLPIVVIALISIRVAGLGYFVDFILGGEVLLISFLILASSFARIINKRIKKRFKCLLVSVMIIVLMEFAFNYTNPLEHPISIYVESISAFLASVVFAVVSAIQEEE